MAHTARPRLAILFAALAALLALSLSGAPAQAQDGSVPGKPTGLSSEASHDSVSLTWDDPGDGSITHYQVFRRDRDVHAAGEFVTVTEHTGSAATSYTDDTVEPERRYVYRVKAVNAHGASTWSGHRRASTPAATPTPTPAPEPEPTPDPADLDPADLAPSGLEASLAENRVTLTWTAPAEDAASVTGYEVLRAQGSAALTTLAADTGNTDTTYTDSGVTGDLDGYRYQVKALRGGDASQGSNVAGVIPSAHAGAIVPLADVTLISNLVLNDGTNDLTLTPTFATDTTSYAASVGGAVSQITVTPTKSDTDASVEYLDAKDAAIADADGTATGQQVDLAVGTTTIKVEVTAGDAMTTETYTVVVTRAATRPAPPSGKAWVEVWSDDFDGDVLDATKWLPRRESQNLKTRTHHGNTIYYRRETDNISVADGKLVLKNTQRRLSDTSSEVLTASIYTQDTYRRKYGYFEASLRIAPTADGIHTGFWMQSLLSGSHSENGGVEGAADGGEIDILESALIRDRFYHALHWDNGGSRSRTSASRRVDVTLHDGEYHVYAVEWSAGRYRFYVDGKLTWTYTGEGVSDGDEYIILATNVSWAGGNAHTGDFPVEALVDWVRVYELQDSTSVDAQAAEPGFGTLGGSVAPSVAPPRLSAPPPVVPGTGNALSRGSRPAISSVEFAYDPDYASYDPHYAGPDDDTYPLAWTVSVEVNFDQDIDVQDLEDGGPRLELDIGGVPKQALYYSKSSRAIVFFYRIQDGDEDMDGISIGADKLALNGASIVGTTGTDAVLDHAAVPDDAGHKVDGVRPVLQAAETSTDGAAIVLTYDEALQPTMNLSKEQQRTTATPYDYTVSVDGVPRGVSDVSASGSTVTLELESAVTAGQTVAVSYREPSVHDDTRAVQNLRGTDAASFTNRTVTVADDDPQVTVGFEHSAYSVAEGASVAVSVVLSADPERTVTIPLTSTNQGGASAADFSGVPASLEFSTTAMSRTFAFAAADDDVDDDGEGVTVGFGTLPAGVNAGTPATAAVSIIDGDVPTVSVSFGSGPYSVDEGETVTVTVSLDEDPERTVVIPLTTTLAGGASAADFSVPANVTFAAGETSKTFEFDAADDDVDDDGEGVTVGFGTLPAGVNAGTPAMVAFEIGDDDVPTVSVSFVASTYSVAEGGSVTVTVSLSADPERTVVIPLTTTLGGGASAADFSVPANVTFDAGDTSQAFTFAAADDGEDDDGEGVTVGFGTLPAGVNAGTPATAAVSIIDGDVPIVSVSFGSGSYSVDEGGSVTVTVSLSADPERTVVIPLTTTLGGGASAADFSVPANVTFDAGDTSQAFTFAAADDGEDDDGEGVTVGFGTLPAGVNAGTPATAAVSIIDDDVPIVSVSFGSGSYSVDEGGSVTVTVSLSADPERTVVIPLTTTLGGGASAADFSVPANVTFAAGETSKTFEFDAADDGEDDDGEGVTVGFGTLPAGVNAGAPAMVAFEIGDDDVPIVSNRSPAFSEGSSTTRDVPENSSAGTALGTAVAASDAEGDTLTYALGGTDAASFDFSTATGQISTGSGVTYDHEAKATYTVTVTVDDGNGGAAGIDVTINVTDEPEPPNAPAAPTVSRTADANDSLDVSWTAPANDGRPALKHYDIQYREGGGAWETGPQTQTGTTAKITSLNAGTSYEVQVRAANDEGNGAWSPAGTGSTNAAPVFDDGEETTREVAENTASGADIGAAVAATDADNDTLSYSLGGTDAASFAIVSTSGQIQTKAALDYEEDDEYSVTVTVTDGSGGEASIDVTIDVTDEDEPPSKPEAPTVTGAGPSSVTATWLAPANAGKPDISDYDVQYRQQGGTAWTDWTHTSTDTSATITGLSANTSYEVQVRATNDEGTSNWSDSDSGATSTKPVVTLSLSSHSIVEGGVTTVTGTVSPASATPFTVTVSVTPVAPAVAADFTPSANANLTFAANATASTGGVTITATANTVHTEDKTLTVSGATTAAAVTAPANVTLTVADDDAPSWTVEVGSASIAEDAGSTTLTVSTGGVSFADDQTITLDLGGTATVTDDYTVSPATLTLKAGNSSAMTTITAVDDALDDEAETIVIAAMHGGAQVGASRTITITDDDAANRAPTFAEGASTTRDVAENTASGQNVGAAVAATDPDSDALTYTLGGTDAVSFDIDSASGQLQTATGTVLDYEARTSYSVTVTVTDSKGGSAAIDVTINVTDEDEPPSAPTELSGLVLNDGANDLTLTPTFATDTTSYAASVGGAVSQITVTPTKSDTDASVEYLDARDAAITDADGTATGQQVDLAVGTTTIKVKVTAGDAMTTETYTVVVTRAATRPAPPSGKAWVEVWSDDFDGDVLDATKWRPQRESQDLSTRTHHGNTIYYRGETDNVGVADGKLVLKNTQRRLSATSSEVLTARISTMDIYHRKYGYFEASVRIAPTADGIDTVFWMQGPLTHRHSENGGVEGAADGGEIDILESSFIRDGFYHALHWDYGGSRRRKSASEWVDVTLHDGEYHVYAVEWSADRYRFYIDGKLTWTYTGEGVSGGDEYIVLSTGVSWAGGNAHTGDFPVEALFDWVRVYELQDSTSVDAQAAELGFGTLGGSVAPSVAPPLSAPAPVAPPLSAPPPVAPSRLSAPPPVVPGTGNALTHESPPAISSVEFAYDPDYDGDPDFDGPDDDTYPLAWTVSVEVKFDRDIHVQDLENGGPRLELDIGGVPKQALYYSKSSRAIVFFYRIQDGDEDMDGISIGADKLDLNGASIVGTTGTDAVLGHAAVPDDAGHKVDGVRPVLQAAEISTDGATIVLTYDEALQTTINNPSNPKKRRTTATPYRYTVSVDGVPRGVSDVSASGSTVTLELESAVTAGQTVAVSYREPSVHDDRKAVQNLRGTDAASFTNRTVTVAGDDTAGVVVVPTVVSVAEGGAAGSYTVVLATQPPGTVTVTVGGAGDDVAAEPAALTFTASTWDTAQTVTVTAVDDSVAEGEETATLTHAVSGYGAVTSADSVTVSITDDDGNTPPTASASVTPDAPAELTPEMKVEVLGGNTVSLDGGGNDPDVGEVLSYAWTSDGGGTFADAAAADTTWTAPAATADEQTVTLTLTVSDSASATAEASVEVTVADNVPLTASFDTIPVMPHAGNNFAVRILFSERIRAGLTDFRNHAVEVTNGTVYDGRRVDGRRDLLELEIDPDSASADVTIVLAPSRACPQSNSICTYAGKQLSAELRGVVESTNTPVFSEGATATREVAENTAADTDIGGAVTATDVDNDTLSYSLGGTDAASFAIVSTSGQVQTKADLDHETKSSYAVTVTVTDGKGGSASIEVTINGTDEDEPPSKPEAPTVTGAGPSSVTATWLAPANAGKPDISDYDVQYREAGTTGSWSDGSHTGTDTSATITGLSANTSYDVQVRATNDEGTSDWSDSGSGATSTKPVVTLSLWSDSIAEGGVTTVRGTVSPASATQFTVTVSVTPVAPAVAADFTLSANTNLTFAANATASTGIVTITATANTVHTEDKTLTVSGATTAAAVTAPANVTLTVEDDDAPSWTVEVGSASIAEDAGFTAVTVSTGGVTFADDQTITLDLSGTATETDDYTVSPATLTLTAGNSSAMTTITAVDDALDDEAETIVIAAMHGGAQIGASRTITITDDDAANRAPTFAEGASTTRKVAENTASGEDIGAPVSATDADSDALTYTLGGTDAASFDIDPASGQLQTSAALDHETAPSHTVTVTADDDKGGTATISVTIEVTNETEPPEEPGAPDNVRALSGNAELVVTWGEPNDGGSAITEYTLQWKSGGESFSSSRQRTIAAPSRSDTIPSLTNGTEYAVRVKATNTHGDSDWSVEATGTPRSSITTGGGGGGGGGPSGPSPSELDFEWNVKRDLEALDGGHDTPTGAWSDGTVLWVLENGDGAGDAVYAYDLNTGERLEEREFELDERNRAPRGVWSGGTVIWVSDSGQDRLFGHDLETGERLPERDLELGERNGDARGIWSDGETMWVLDGGKDSVFAYDLGSGELVAEYALDDANGDPHGIWSDGVTIWVSDHGAKRLFAYRLEDGELVRNSEEEFTELSKASNNSPRGIWGNADVIYVADESDDKVYSYNMPDAIDARLASLTLSGIEIGEFSGDRTEYDGVAAEGVTETTVEAEALQRRTTVLIEPADAGGDDTNGHQLALEGIDAITVTVTSADGSRTRVYRVRLGDPDRQATPDPWTHCLRGDVAEGFSLVVYEGGSVEELVTCAESRDVVALYALHGGVYVSYILGAPGFVNQPFAELFADGVPPVMPLVAGSSGPPSADPNQGDGALLPWPECLRGEIAAGFSLVIYEGGSVDDLVACAQSLAVTALYTLDEGEFVSYILGAPEFVNRKFRELFPHGVPPLTPLVAASDGR